jgi:spore coat protein U-like protein
VATSTISFGNLIPTVTGDVAVTTQLNIRCSKDTAFTITSGVGLSMNHSVLADTIPYTLTLPSGNYVKTVPAVSLAVDITGEVLAIDYNNASEGFYSDTVVLTLSP